MATTTGADGTTTDIPRFSTTPPSRTTFGNLDAMALYAGTSIDAVRARQTASEVMHELIEGTRHP